MKENYDIERKPQCDSFNLFIVAVLQARLQYAMGIKMINYIRSELYRGFRERFLYIFSAVLAATFIGLCLFTLSIKNMAGAGFPYSNTGFIFMNVTSAMFLPMIFTFFISNLIIGEESKNHTMKNSVSFGTGRLSIYFGKFITEIVLCMAITLFLFVVIIASSYLTLENSGNENLYALLRAILGSLPLWIAGLVTFHCLFFLFDNSSTIIAVFSLIHFGPYYLLKIFGNVYEWPRVVVSVLPLGIFNEYGKQPGSYFLNMVWDTPLGMLRCWIVGIVFSLIFGYIGYKCFLNKEVK